MMSAMSLRRLALGVGLLLAGALPAAQPPAAQPPAATVEFAPAVVAKLHDYGEDQGATLRNAILAAVANEARTTPEMAGLEIVVTVEDLAPSHPTQEQLMADPAADPTRSHFLGGAELAGEVRDGSGRVLATVTHRFFAPTLRLGSASKDPWGDARRAIDQFAIKLAAACRALPRS